MNRCKDGSRAGNVNLPNCNGVSVFSDLNFGDLLGRLVNGELFIFIAD